MHQKKKSIRKKQAVKQKRKRKEAFLRKEEAWSLDEQLNDELHDSQRDYFEWWGKGYQSVDYALQVAIEELKCGTQSRETFGKQIAAARGKRAPEGKRSSDIFPVSKQELPDRLLVHLKTVLSANTAAIEELLPTEWERRRLRHIKRQEGSNDIAMAMLFSKFWVRPLKEWKQPEKDVERSLFDHLFVLYPVPEFLYENISKWGWSQADVKGISWLILLGQGASLEKCARRFGWIVGKGFVKHLFDKTPNMFGDRVCIWAEVHRLGGDREAYDLMCSWAATFMDSVEAKTKYADFWHELVQWMLRHRKALGPDIRMVLGWAVHCHTEFQHHTPPFSISRYAARRALREAEAYERARERSSQEQLSWRGHEWNWQHVAEEAVWSVIELTSTDNLAEEGSAMGHCVVLYARRCKAGMSAIVSLRRDGIRALTIELDPRTKVIVQVRGLRNRSPTKEEGGVVALWWQSVSGENGSAQA
jgi:hypothetical protein